MQEYTQSNRPDTDQPLKPPYYESERDIPLVGKILINGGQARGFDQESPGIFKPEDAIMVREVNDKGEYYDTKMYLVTPDKLDGYLRTLVEGIRVAEDKQKGLIEWKKLHHLTSDFLQIIRQVNFDYAISRASRQEGEKREQTVQDIRYLEKSASELLPSYVQFFEALKEVFQKEFSNFQLDFSEEKQKIEAITDEKLSYPKRKVLEAFNQAESAKDSEELKFIRDSLSYLRDLNPDLVKPVNAQLGIFDQFVLIRRRIEELPTAFSIFKNQLEMGRKFLQAEG